jgi:glycosyltransferase involved in cell wall biosynthesis
VTVLVSTYNREEMLRGALESVLAQTYEPFRVVILDDASPDGTQAVTEEYEAQHPDRVCTVRAAVRRGATAGINEGFKRFGAATDYVAFIADDDLWAPEKLEKQVAAFGEDPSLGLVVTEAQVIDASGALVQGQRFTDMYERWTGDPARFLFLRKNFICASSAMIRRVVLDTFGGAVPTELFANADHFMWIAATGDHGFEYLDEALTSYRVSPGMMTKVYSWRMHQEDLALRREAYARFEGIRRRVTEREARDAYADLAYRALKDAVKGRRPSRIAWALKELIRSRPSPTTLRRLTRQARLDAGRLRARGPDTMTS